VECNADDANAERLELFPCRRAAARKPHGGARVSKTASNDRRRSTQIHRHPMLQPLLTHDFSVVTVQQQAPTGVTCSCVSSRRTESMSVNSVVRERAP
jgi:hypothetical protein